VQCHYGQRPEWMDDGVKARGELEKMKNIIKVSAARKRATFREKNRRAASAEVVRSQVDDPVTLNPPTQHPPISPRGSHDSPYSQTNDSVFSEFILQSPHSRDSTCVQTEHPVLPDFPPQHVSESRQDPHVIPVHTKDLVLLDSILQPLPFKSDVLNPSWVNDDEADLMMHYLDHVFYIQFRFYKPAVSRGRGWLLSLLTCTKPLYHAALSLSAFHRQSLLIDQGIVQTDSMTLRELEWHHNLTLKELQLFIQDHSAVDNPGRHIQILACIVQLISFEVWHFDLLPTS